MMVKNSPTGIADAQQSGELVSAPPRHIQQVLPREPNLKENLTTMIKMEITIIPYLKERWKAPFEF